MKGRPGAILAAAAIGLGSCGDDGFPDYRYRMTVEVETSEGVRTGSSVIEVRTEEVATLQDTSGRTFRTKVKGEAVPVDVAPGLTIFALLEQPDDSDYAKGVAFSALKPVRETRGTHEGYREHLSQMTKVQGPRELPRERWPYFVRFEDMADPKSIRAVSPDDPIPGSPIEARISKVLIELTDDGPDDEIMSRLPWLATVKGAFGYNGNKPPEREELGLGSRAFRKGFRN